MKQSILATSLCLCLSVSTAGAFDLIEAKIRANGVNFDQPKNCDTKKLKRIKIKSGVAKADTQLAPFLGRWCGFDQSGNSFHIAIVDIIPPKNPGGSALAEIRVGHGGKLKKSFGLFFFDRIGKQVALDLKSHVFWFVQDNVARYASWNGIKSGRVDKNGFRVTLLKR